MLCVGIDISQDNLGETSTSLDGFLMLPKYKAQQEKLKQNGWLKMPK